MATTTTITYLFSPYFAPGTVIFSLPSYFLLKKIGVGVATKVGVAHFRYDVTL